jgi:hypothetical protein
MPSISLFVEDLGHEAFLRALLERMARECDVDIEIRPRSVRGGHGKVISELQQYIRDLNQGYESLPDLLVVAKDANCKGFVESRREIDTAANDKVKDLIVCAIPDPHIERWLLLDSVAFKEVIGKGCDAPDRKCERHRYKQLLLKAMRDAGVSPPLGGIEYAEDIVNVMDLRRMESADDSLGRLLQDLREKFRVWCHS